LKRQEALTIIDGLFLPVKLNDLQSAVFLETWAEHSYSEIAQQLGYEYDYIKQVGSRLWRSLSQILGEPVSKRNIQSVLRRYQQIHLSCQHSNCHCYLENHAGSTNDKISISAIVLEESARI
jgi:hypothetical protein